MALQQTKDTTDQAASGSAIALETKLKAKARALGFSAMGVTAPAAATRQDLMAALGGFLARGCHGDMAWLASDPERRARPERLWPEAKSIIMLGVNYGSPLDPLRLQGQADHGAISVYAQGTDYHDTIKKNLKVLARWLIAEAGGAVKVFVDTAPVMEKPLGQAAGIGWQGKHTNLVSRDFGSWLFLGAIFTTLDLSPDKAESDHCGGCRRCLDICPTQAFPAPYRLDARRCISYLTIEHKGHIPRELRQAIANRIYGCDDCLAVCPWNKFAKLTAELAFMPRAELIAPRLSELAGLDDASFRALFSGSPVKRLGRARFVRNVAIALGNAGVAAPVGLIEKLCADASPLVRAAAIWALSQVAPKRFQALGRERAASEPDPAVRAEWQVEV